MIFKNLSTIIAGTLVALVIAPANAKAEGPPSPVGSWVVAVTPDPFDPLAPPPFSNLVTLLRGGLLTNSDPQGFGCHGVWERTGPQEIATFFLCLAGGVTIAVTSDPADPLTFDGDEDHMMGGFTTVITDPNQPEFTFSGIVALTRITIPD